MIERRIDRIEQDKRKEFWADKRVVVTGGSGFLGTHLANQLREFNPKELIIPRRKDFDLRIKQNCLQAVKGADVIVHLAANVGGIGYNREHPSELLVDNLLMCTYMMEAALESNVKKYVALGTVCAYPKFTPVPFREDSLWDGYPEETNAPYGLAKKMQLVQAQAYRQQYGFNAIYLLPVNLYGPGDNFNPESSHVIPALIKKYVEARDKNKPYVDAWGTGKATREFLYAPDAAEAILLAAEKYNSAEPVNIGSGQEISIKELTELIQELVGYKGEVRWDTSQPDGQPRRMLDTSRAEVEFGFKAKTDFRTGLENTIQWYLKNRDIIK